MTTIATNGSNPGCRGDTAATSINAPTKTNASTAIGERRLQRSGAEIRNADKTSTARGPPQPLCARGVKTSMSDPSRIAAASRASPAHCHRGSRESARAHARACAETIAEIAAAPPPDGGTRLPPRDGHDFHSAADDIRGGNCQPEPRRVPQLEGTAVKLTLVRTIPFTLAVAIAALAVSGIDRFKDATHGVDLVVGDIAWFGFLAAALAAIVLTGIAVYRRRRR